MDKKTKYFTTLTWKIWYTEIQSTSQQLQGRFGTQKDKVLHNSDMARKTKYFTTLTSYMEDLVHRKTKYFIHLNGGFGPYKDTQRQSISHHLQVTCRVWHTEKTEKV